MNRKKIIYVITKSNWGGAQRYVFDLATANKDTYDVTVAFGGTGKQGACKGILAEKLEAAGVRTHFIPSFMRDISMFREFSALYDIYKFFKKEQPAIVHLNSSKAGGLGALAARLAHIPKIIFTAHGLPYDEDRGTFARISLTIATWLTCLFSHYVIVLSQNNAIRARRLPFIDKKIILIYNSIPSTVPFIPRADARAMLGLTDTETPVIGTIAEFTKNKGLSYLVRAFVHIREHGIAARLCIIGDGEAKNAITQFIKEKNLSSDVSFPGFIKDAGTLLQALDIFVLPSIKEGLPYVVLEAGVAALPTIATAVGGVPEIITDMESGIIVRPKTSRELAAAIKFLLENRDTAKKFGASLQQSVAKKFSSREMIEKVAALYEKTTPQ